GRSGTSRAGGGWGAGRRGGWIRWWRRWPSLVGEDGGAGPPARVDPAARHGGGLEAQRRLAVAAERDEPSRAAERLDARERGRAGRVQRDPEKAQQRADLVRQRAAPEGRPLPPARDRARCTVRPRA